MQFNLTGRFAKAGGPKLREIFAVSIVDVCKLCYSPLDHCLCSSWWQSCTGTDRGFEEQGVFTTKLATTGMKWAVLESLGACKRCTPQWQELSPLDLLSLHWGETVERCHDFSRRWRSNWRPMKAFLTQLTMTPHASAVHGQGRNTNVVKAQGNNHMEKIDGVGWL